jgi:hypothetical protein
MSKRTVSVAYEDPRFSKKEAAYWSQVRNALDAMGAPNSGELLHNSKAYVEGVYKAGVSALDAAAVIWHKHCHGGGTAAVPCVAEEGKNLDFVWHQTAPGTSALKPDKTHGYTAHGWFGEYHISAPTQNNRGYLVMWANTTGRNFGPKGAYGGLWHEVGIYRSPNEAKAAAIAHAKATLGGPLPSSETAAEDNLVSGEPWVLLEPGLWEWRTMPYPPGGYAIAQLSGKKGFQLGRWDSRIGRKSFVALAIYPSLEAAQNGAAMYAAQPGGREAKECPCDAKETAAERPPGSTAAQSVRHPEYEKWKVIVIVKGHDQLPIQLVSNVSLDKGVQVAEDFLAKHPKGSDWAGWKIHDVVVVPDQGMSTSHLAEANDSAPSCVPFTRLERNNVAFEACQKIANGPLEDDAAMYRLLKSQLGKEDQEVFVVVGLDLHRNLRSYTEVARGQRDRVTVNVEDVLRAAILDGPHGFIVAHNHPSGKASPSPADRDLTRRIRAAANVGCPSIVFLDHIVVGQNEYFSFADNKLKRVR